ncbi:MAG: vitamin B12/cobalamin outer membrane transporter [Candidatus Cloacimonetes bacterium ADurb.Bin089]|nr:MAG: vitamin B12/cobalamin outer membrane transporter [Candidatus Cloacimonetes bacterium ADurb.Bin089]
MPFSRFFTVFVFLFAFFAMLNGIKVTGIVTDEENKPLETVRLVSGKKTTLSKQNGSFTLEVTDSLQVNRLGYKKRTLSLQEVRSLPITTSGIHIILQNEPIQLSTYRVFVHLSEENIAAADLVTLQIDPDKHYSSASELISQTAAFQSSGTLLKGETAQLNILGNISRHTLVLLDGIAMNTLGEPFDFSRLNVDNIESIEIVKNNASVYGGASAIGGIIMITTKQGAAIKTNLESKTEFGSYGYLMQQITVSGFNPENSYRLCLNAYNADNDFPIRKGELIPEDSESIRKNNSKQQLSFSGAYSTNLAKLQMNISADYLIFHRELPGPLNFADLYYQAFLEGSSLRPQIRFSANFGNFTWQSNNWLIHDETTYDNTRSLIEGFSQKYSQKNDNYGIKQSLNYHKNSLQASLNGEYSNNRYRYRDLIYPSQGKIDYVRNQLAFSFKLNQQKEFAWLIFGNGLAGRYDYIEDEDEFSGRLEFSVRNWGTKYLETGATIGNSFALPSPFDLYWKGDSQTLGNPNLKSEKATGYQLWLKGNIPQATLKATFHQNKIKNLIQWRQVQMYGPVWKPMNIGKAVVQNLELEGNCRPLKQLELTASAVFTKAKDTTCYSFAEAPKLMYRPKALYALAVDYQPGIFHFWTKYSYTGKQWITPDNLIDPISAYALVDCGISFLWQKGNWQITPALTVKNIFNENYMVHSYVPEPGRTFYATLQLNR